jgi:hypothetical protein
MCRKTVVVIVAVLIAGAISAGIKSAPITTRFATGATVEGSHSAPVAIFRFDPQRFAAESDFRVVVVDQSAGR